MDNMRPINQLRRVIYGGDTARFHTLHMNRRPDVAGHSFRVAWLCYIFTEGQASAALIMAALGHDLAEGDLPPGEPGLGFMPGGPGLGDIPSPTKRALGMRAKFAELEEEVMHEAGLGGLEAMLTPEGKRILKLADNMAGMIECLQERRTGNTGICHIYNNFHEYFEEVLTTDDYTAAIIGMWVEHEWESLDGR